MEMTTAALVEPTGLRQARQEMAAAKRAAKPSAPAKKAPAKKAPAKKAAAAGPKLRWTVVKEHQGGKEQTAAFDSGELAIVRAGQAWRAVYRVDGTVRETLAEGTFGKCYGACTTRSKAGAK
jgi:hypothetical protein